MLPAGAESARLPETGLALLERIRWGTGTPSCPRCGSGRVYAVRRRAGRSSVERRIWSCGGCRRQFSVLTGTVLSGSRIPVDTLLAVLVHWAVEGRPRPVEVARQRSITAEAARLLVRRIDAALERGGCGDPLRAVLGGPPGRALAARAVTPSRASRPGRTGPSADYGDG